MMIPRDWQPRDGNQISPSRQPIWANTSTAREESAEWPRLETRGQTQAVYRSRVTWSWKSSATEDELQVQQLPVPMKTARRMVTSHEQMTFWLWAPEKRNRPKHKPWNTCKEAATEQPVLKEWPVCLKLFVSCKPPTAFRLVWSENETNICTVFLSQISTPIMEKATIISVLKISNLQPKSKIRCITPETFSRRMKDAD